jgi:hypothetical protein
MNTRCLLLILLLLVGLLAMINIPTSAAGSLELYGTFESMGVIVTLDVSDDPDGDAIAQVE